MPPVESGLPGQAAPGKKTEPCARLQLENILAQAVGVNGFVKIRPVTLKVPPCRVDFNRKMLIPRHTIPLTWRVSKNAHSPAVHNRFQSANRDPSASRNVSVGDRAHAPGVDPADLPQTREGWKMWEALAAMTLICVMILIVYQVIEKKFRERHV